jgi:hypothetical protein
MDIVTKDTKLHFIIAALVASALSAALHQWLVALIVAWVVLAMGGFLPFWSKNQKVTSIQWGCLFGLTISLAVLLFSPLGAKLYAI